MDAAYPKSNRFLYDDYMDSSLYNRGRSTSAGASGAYDAYGGGGAARGTRRSMLDVDEDAYAMGGRTRAEPMLSRRREIPPEQPRAIAADGAHARRFADALNIAPAVRVAHQYHDVDYGVPSRAIGGGRPLFRELPTARIAPFAPRRRVYTQGYNDFDVPGGGQEFVEVVERVRHVPRRMQVVKKVPIHQRVVKKVFVDRSGGGGGNKRRGPVSEKIGRVGGGGGVQKRVLGGRVAKDGGATRPGAKKGAKPKLSAKELDRELEDYMAGTKHPRVEV